MHCPEAKAHHSPPSKVHNINQESAGGTNIMGDALLNLEEVGHRLGGISEKSVRRLIASGELPQPVKILSVPTLPESEVARYIEAKKNQRGNTPS
jgi:predicted DNA-binding transcriptional regulator AlpA